MAISIDLYIDQGTDFLAILPAVTSNTGAVVDLTNYTFICQIRRSYASQNAVQLNVVAPTPTNGILNLSLPKTETVGLAPFRYVYDVVITNTGTSYATKVFEGQVIVNPGVSGKPNSTLLTPYVPDDYGAI